MKILSVIVPVSVKADNHQSLIRWLASQDYNDVEVIVVLDEAAASSEQIIKTRNAFLPFAVKVLSDSFGSPGLARNAGMQVNKSEWVAFWDADDLPLIGNFHQMVQEANQKGFNICVGDYILRDLESGALKYRKLPDSDDLDLLPALIGRDPGIWRFAFRKKVLERMFMPVRMAEDQIFLMENKIFDHDIYLGHKIVYCYSYGGIKQSTSNKSLIEDLKEAISISINHLSAIKVSPNCQFASTLLSRQMLTALKRGSFKLRLWTLREVLNRIIHGDRMLIADFFRSFLNLRQRQGSSHQRDYVALTGGLGNQLFQLAYALNNSKGQGATLISNIGAPRLNHFGAPELLSYQIPCAVAELKPSASNWIVRKSCGYMLRSGVSPRKFDEFPIVRKATQLLWQLVLSFSFSQKIKPLAAKTVGYFDLNSRKNSNFQYGYFQSYKWANSVIHELRDLTLAETSSSLKRYIELAMNEKPLIVHIRLGDYRSETNFGFPGNSYYALAIDIAWATGHYGSIWVFSDEITAAKELLPSEHQKHYRFIQDANLSSAEVLEIMRLGKGYVIANSTFSWWGAYLSKSRNPLVIAPTPWFSAIESPKDLIPDSWTTIETVQSERNFKNIDGT
jgi:glycosyltransferase involved in cell wall biosynthesis